ncbi:DUF6443 domain-containing protein [Dysgonomonas sp. 25]|uniref:DUF6443 domain-containing protein n=1 Tax=Dysgonomonas sp. 25 TaxID=2302933 RepID=UPI0013D42EF3|nr:DUF6443 domain-containing protein [Dysgonomonas sp. 25]
MDITIHHCGSELSDTYIRLYKDDTYRSHVAQASSNDLKEITCGLKYQACLIYKNLPAGTYYILSAGDYTSENDKNKGKITTTITGYCKTLIQQNLGTKNEEFTFSHTANTEESVSEWSYRPYNDVIYYFTLTKKMKVFVSHQGSQLAMTCMTLQEVSTQKVLQIRCSTNDITGSSESIETILNPGTYRVISEGALSNGIINTIIQGFDPFFRDIGTRDKSFTYAHTQNTEESENIYGNSPKDITYKLTATAPMDLFVSHDGSELVTTNIFIFNEEKTRSWSASANNGECSSPTNAYLKITGLPAGTYYIVSEGKTGNGVIKTTIEGIHQGSAITQKENLNYIKTRSYYDGEYPYKYLDAFQYFDGLGRPEQTVQKGITPTGKDLISIQQYDSFGREDKSWLPTPYSSEGNRVEPLVIQNIAKNAIYNDQKPYTKPTYENSPLNRITEQYGPGQTWHWNEKAVRYEYGTNKGAIATAPTVTMNKPDTLSGAIAACNQIILSPGFSFKASSEKNLYLYIDPSQCNQPKSLARTVTTSRLSSLNAVYLTCMRWNVSNNQLARKGNYNNNELYVTLVSDEDDNISLEFKNQLGQVVLMRQLNGSEKYDTYYVYDDYGNLRYVLPPLAVDKLTSDLSDDNEIMQQYAYLYKYDHRNRCIKKRLPGCDWIYMVYDQADRLIFTQDGEQRIQDEWLFNIPDIFGRPVLSGICKNTISESQIETYLKNVVVTATLPELADGSYKGYNISGVTLNNWTLLTANYYDNYTYLKQADFSNQNLRYVANNDYGTRYGDDNSTYQHKGLLTGSITSTMGASTAPRELYSTMYYDNKKRAIQTRSTNHLGGYDYSYTAYDFVGNPTKTLTEHIARGGTTKELYTYTYDHAGRMTETKHKINDQPEISLAKNTYDELGRLKNTIKNDHPNLKTTYTYNIRSWVDKIQEPHFVEQLTYAYNGNIKTMGWTQDNLTRKYTYTYDNLSRLQKADYVGINQDEKYGTQYTYDKMGNMMTLQRYGKITANNYNIVDNLTMAYNGNQLIKVTDTGAEVALEESEDFKDWTNQTVEYTYNKNGALTKDLNKGIGKIEYNSLNLPRRMDIKSPVAEARTDYLYSATGVKLRVDYWWNPNFSTNPVIGSALNTPSLQKKRIVDYVGNKIYENNVLNKILVDGGYIEAGQYHFYTKDHLGNNRAVATSNGTVTRQNHYYPFGASFADGLNKDKDAYKYNGKEQDRMHGLDWYDYSARHMSPAVPRFTTVDPLAEKKPWLTPYHYCSNNPINRIDPDGMYDIIGMENNEKYGVVSIFHSKYAEDEKLLRAFNRVNEAGLPILVVDNIEDLAAGLAMMQENGIETDSYTISAHGYSGTINFAGNYIDKDNQDFSVLKDGFKDKNIFIGSCFMTNSTSEDGKKFVRKFSKQTEAAVIVSSDHGTPLGYTYTNSNYLSDTRESSSDMISRFDRSFHLTKKGKMPVQIFDFKIDQNGKFSWETVYDEKRKLTLEK